MLALSLRAAGAVKHAGAVRAASSAAAAIRKGSKVKVVLLDLLDNLGHRGEEVAVAPGYARNFLIPQKKAVYATADNVARHKVVLPTEEQRRIAAEREVNMLRARVSQVKLSFARATSDGVALYGSVLPSDIAEALANTPLKKLGVTEAGVRFLDEAGEHCRAIKTVGSHVCEVQARPGLWCALGKVVVSSS